MEEKEKKARTRREMRSLRDASDPFNIPETTFINNFRLSRATCRALIADLEPSYSNHYSTIPFTLKLLSALHFFGHGSYQKCTGNNFILPMSQASVSRSLHEICKLIEDVKQGEIVFPITDEEKDAIKVGFHSRFGIKSTIGAIDCSHIPIVAPPSTDPAKPVALYMNRKGYYSINVEAVCDHQLRILAINSKFPGATHDSGIWSTSEVKEHLIRNHSSRRNCWLIGDQGYPLEPWLMTPLSEPVTVAEKKYNKMHASARNCIERCIGVLKSRFRCLSRQRVLHYSHDNASRIINCCAILHNILIKSGAPMDTIDEDVGVEYLLPSENCAQSDREGERTRMIYISSL